MKYDRKETIKCIILIIITTVGLITGMILQKNIYLVGYILALLFGSILIGAVLILGLKTNLKSSKYYYPSSKKRTCFAFGINFIFSAGSTAFIVHHSDTLGFLIANNFALILIIIIVYHFTNIENIDDLSLLKATNYFVVLFFTVLKLLNIEEWFEIEYYFILPLTLTQGLYELLERKAKRHKVPNSLAAQAAEM